LCETAVTTVSVPEMFRYWLMGGRISVGFLGAAQLDRFGNINTTVIGDYGRPHTRLPGGGGAPEIATSCRRIFITMKQSTRGMVGKIDFFTSFGHGEGGDHRKRLGIDTQGPVLLVTDLAIWKPDPVTREFTVVSLHPGATKEQVAATCGWPAKFAAKLEETPAPNALELQTLRDLHARTKAAHAGAKEA
jgi:glutaconate CoA-transferase subunit B